MNYRRVIKVVCERCGNYHHQYYEEPEHEDEHEVRVKPCEDCARLSFDDGYNIGHFKGYETGYVEGCVDGYKVGRKSEK